MGTAFLILLLLTVCGFIAYIGDLLGRRFGKKRLTLFGLRPKHTAIVLTIATGVVIAGLTFLAALLIVPGFRQAVTQGEHLVGQNRHYRLENVRLEQSTNRLSASNTQLQSTNAALSQTNGTLKKTNDTLNKQSAELRGKNGELTRANTQLQSHNTELRGTNSRLTADNSRLQSEQSKLQATTEALKQQVMSLKTVATTYRQEKYIYRLQEPIDKEVLPAQWPTQILPNTLVNLLYAAEQKARGRGARAGAGHRAMYLVPPPGYPKGRPADEAAIRRWLTERITAKHPEALFLRVVAHENVLRGNPVPATIEWYSNDRIFSAGELVKAPDIGCWWPVDGAKASQGAILKELIYFLRIRVNQAARKRHIIADAEGAVGSDQGLDYDQILDTAQKVKAINSNAVVVARARQETHRAGPLYVDLVAYPVDDKLPEDVRQAIEEAAREGAGH